MAISNNLQPGMIISVGNKLFKVESSVKVTVPKGTPFIKAKMKDLETNKIVEKNFKLDQSIKEVSLISRPLEYLYMEGKDYLFLDVDSLEQVLVPNQVVEARSNYLKEGVEVAASFYGENIFAVELPQFIELMVSKTEDEQGVAANAGANKIAVLETGARIEVPSFIEAGDIVKVDTRIDEYIQRV